MFNKKTDSTIREILLEVCQMWSWTFTYDFELLRTNCKFPNLFTKIMLEERHMKALSESKPGSAPLILSNSMGLMFSAVFGDDSIWFLGPVYTVEVSEKDIEKLLVPYNLTYKTTLALIDNLRQVPMISSSDVFEKTLIMHRLVNDEVLSASDLRFHVAEDRMQGSDRRSEESSNVNHITEKRLLDCVRHGDLQFRDILTHAATVSSGTYTDTGDPIRKAKYSVVSFITLCSRAAIEGGLPADTASLLYDTYINDLITCRTISEITALNHMMYEDFIHRVHRSKLSNMSRGVKIACEYIEMHYDEEISLSLISDKAGYTPYYLSRKFKKETGLSPSEYIQKKRLERAKSLLSTGRMNIQEIADSLGFCSRSYFSDVFSKEYGMSPGAWRENNLNP